MDDLTKKVIAQRINTLLAERDIKQKDLAKVLGVADNIISYYVSGKRTPNVEQIIKLSSFFGVPSDYLLGLTNSTSVDLTIREISNITGLEDLNISSLHRDVMLIEEGKDIQRSDNYIFAERTVDFIETKKLYFKFLNEFISDENINSYQVIRHFFNYIYSLNEVIKICTDVLQILEKINNNTVFDEISTYLTVFETKAEELKELNLSDDIYALLNDLLKLKEQSKNVKYERFEIIENLQELIDCFCLKEQDKAKELYNKIFDILPFGTLI